MIKRTALYVFGLAVLFIVRKISYENSSDFNPVLLFGALIWFAVLTLSLLPGLDNVKLRKKEIISRAALFGMTAGLVLWTFLFLVGKPAHGGVVRNMLVLAEFVVGYALLGCLISIPTVFLRGRHK